MPQQPVYWQLTVKPTSPKNYLERCAWLKTIINSLHNEKYIFLGHFPNLSECVWVECFINFLTVQGIIITGKMWIIALSITIDQ